MVVVSVVPFWQSALLKVKFNFSEAITRRGTAEKDIVLMEE